MEQILDRYLAKEDQRAVEDGEADEWVYCCICGTYVRVDQMQPLEMMCDRCKEKEEA